MNLRAAASCLVLLAGCADAAIGSLERPIVGGELDTGDLAVAAVQLLDEQGATQAICTGTLVSPHVVLTAAHCIHDGPAYAARVVFGARVGEALHAIDVVAAEYHESYDPARPDGGFDLALLLLAEAPPVTPLAINRKPLEGREGHPVRLVGFGTTGGRREDQGVKRQVTSALDEIAARLLFVRSPERNTCTGDSGGPLLVDLGDGEVVAGVTSYGDPACDTYGAFVRVDAHAAAVIDPWIAANDPLAPLPDKHDDSEVLPDDLEMTGCSAGGAAGGGTWIVLAPLLLRRRARRP